MLASDCLKKGRKASQPCHYSLPSRRTHTSLQSWSGLEHFWHWLYETWAWESLPLQWSITHA